MCVCGVGGVVVGGVGGGVGVVVVFLLLLLFLGGLTVNLDRQWRRRKKEIKRKVLTQL